MKKSSLTSNSPRQRRIVIAITGATGACYGVRCLELLQDQPEVETHLVISPAGWLNIQHELARSRDEIRALADTVHAFKDIGSRSEEHTSELQSRGHLVCRLLLETK